MSTPAFYLPSDASEEEQAGTMEPGRHQTNDELTQHAQGAGVWGVPSMPDDLQQPAHLPVEGFDYSSGMFVGVPGQEADAVPGTLHPLIVAKLTTDAPKSYEALHEATHRRFDAPLTLPIVQTAAGFLMVAPPKMGLHFIKVLACSITLDVAGTLKLVQGASDGTQTGDLTGAMNLGGASAPPFALAPAPIETPWLFTASDQALGIFTVTGKAQGFITVCYSPYEA